MKRSLRSAVPPFQVMDILDKVSQLRSEGRYVISLCAGEPSGGAPPDVHRIAAGQHTDGAALGYTSALGTAELREAVAGHYRHWYGLDVDPAAVGITTGSSGAFLVAFLAAFDPGDRVALAAPGYPAYRNILRALGVEVVELECGPEVRFQPTPALLDAAVAAGGPIVGVVVASPANPTGTMLSRGDLTGLADWCAGNDARLVSDEIYHGITYPPPGSPDPRGVCAWEVDRTSIVVSSFSKFWGMTGWRLGWALVPEDLRGAVDALAGNIALCPPAPAQQAALGAFTPDSYRLAEGRVAEFERTRAHLLGQLDRLGWGPIAPADGAFYLYACLGDNLAPFADSMAWCAALLENAGVALVPGIDFDPYHGRDYVRLSFAAGFDAVAEAVERIIGFQAGLAGLR